jgi:hypothetical protein
MPQAKPEDRPGSRLSRVDRACRWWRKPVAYSGVVAGLAYAAVWWPAADGGRYLRVRVIDASGRSVPHGQLPYHRAESPDELEAVVRTAQMSRGPETGDDTQEIARGLGKAPEQVSPTDRRAWHASVHPAPTRDE